MDTVRPFWLSPTSELSFDHLATDGVTLITPTGDRPELFKLAERWMGRQTYDGPLQWVVVDDGFTPTQTCLGQTYVRRGRLPSDPKHTLAVNLLAALPHVRYENVLIIEDDDWYAPHYVERVRERLQHIPLVGEAYAIYYRLQSAMWKTFHNKRWASLAATALRGSEALWNLHHVCAYGAWVDLALWRRFPGRKYAFGRGDKPSIVQFKGLPGRAGIGSHHTSERGFISDLNRTRLRRWIGDDLDVYAPFMTHNVAMAS